MRKSITRTGLVLAVVAGASLVTSGCSLIPTNHLTADYSGDFTQEDCAKLMGEVSGQDSQGLIMQTYCAQQLGTLGQEGFNKMMHDTIVGIANLNGQLDKLKDPNFWKSQTN